MEMEKESEEQFLYLVFSQSYSITKGIFFLIFFVCLRKRNFHQEHEHLAFFASSFVEISLTVLAFQMIHMLWMLLIRLYRLCDCNSLMIRYVAQNALVWAPWGWLIFIQFRISMEFKKKELKPETFRLSKPKQLQYYEKNTQIRWIFTEERNLT